MARETQATPLSHPYPVLPDTTTELLLPPNVEADYAEGAYESWDGRPDPIEDARQWAARACERVGAELYWERVIQVERPDDGLFLPEEYDYLDFQ
ncbi:hypothetical protein JCM3770_000550 [Rhodotorula araucariae]